MAIYNQGTPLSDDLVVSGNFCRTVDAVRRGPYAWRSVKFVGWKMRLIIFTGRNEVVAKVIFLHLFVILFTGGVLPQCMLGYHPPRPDTTPPPPGKQTPAYGLRAAGTHPTGMHSYLQYYAPFSTFLCLRCFIVSKYIGLETSAHIKVIINCTRCILWTSISVCVRV